LSGGRVAVVEAGDDVRGAVEEAIGLVGGLRLRGGEHVVIKPNVCNAKNPYGMVNTDFRIIEAVVDLVRDEAEKVTVVESDNISGSALKKWTWSSSTSAATSSRSTRSRGRS